MKGKIPKGKCSEGETLKGNFPKGRHSERDTRYETTRRGSGTNTDATPFGSVIPPFATGCRRRHPPLCFSWPSSHAWLLPGASRNTGCQTGGLGRTAEICSGYEKPRNIKILKGRVQL